MLIIWDTGDPQPEYTMPMSGIGLFGTFGYVGIVGEKSVRTTYRVLGH